MAGKREQQMKEITERLEQGVKELFTSEMYTEYLKTMAQFHNYSFNNTLLIALQKPDATLVAGYQAWQKKFKRQVKKGEKGIQIIAPAPIREKEEVEKFDPITNEPILRPDGQPETEEVVHTIPRFRVATVFDVSQTYGEPLPELDTPELVGNVENYEIFMEALRELSPVPIRFDAIESGAKGYYSNTEKEIVIQSDMSESQTMKTGVHEVTHAKLHDRRIMEELGEKKNQMTREVEAESVAYTVCQSFGLDTSDYSFPYIAGWSSSVEMQELRTSMETIRRTAGEMIDGITEVMQRLQQEREEQNLESEERFFSGQTDRYAIYQIVGDIKGRDYRFMNLDFVSSHGIKVDGADYSYIYGGQLSEDETLDSLYKKFNVDHPESYTGRSLSVSDVVVLQKGGEVKAYYVDSLGFQELPDFVQERLHETMLEGKGRHEPVTMDSTAVAIEQHEGLWHPVEKREIKNEVFYLMEHNEYGDSVAAVVVHANGDLVAQELESGFDQGVMEAIQEYLADRGIDLETETQKDYPPVYLNTLTYAMEHGAADEYLDSRKLNIDCKKAVEENIRTHFGGLRLAEGTVEPVLEEYGKERLAFVLACTVQKMPKEGRFSRDNRAWAESIFIPENMERGTDANLDYVADSHPAVLDGFIRIAREQFAEMEKEQEKHTQGSRDFFNQEHAYALPEEKGYFFIQSSVAGGYDYTFYDKEYMELDGGSYDNPELSPEKAAEELLSEEGIHLKECQPMDVEELMAQTEEAEQKRLQEKLEEYREEIPLTSGLTESERALEGMSREKIEETVLCYAQAKLEEMGLEQEVKLLGARVYGSRTREGFYQDESDLDVVLSYTGNIREDAFFHVLHEDGMKIAGLALDINPVSAETSCSLEDYLKQAEKYLNLKTAEKQPDFLETEKSQEAKISFYAAECMEFPILGEYHENLTLEEALECYDAIPADRLSAIKGIGFRLEDGSEYDGEYPLMSGGIVARDLIDLVPHYKESPLVQQAASALEELLSKRQQQARSTETEKEEKNIPKEDRIAAAGGRRQSVLEALRKRQKHQQEQKPRQEENAQNRKKGEQEL